jgi:uncharacterized membrane protein (DUF4010 family)
VHLDLLTSLQRLAVALLVGLLIGIDRERSEKSGQHIFAGVRTFPLIALVGAVSMLLYPIVGPFLLVASFLAVTAVALVAYVRSSAAGEVGATTEIAAIATFLLGAIAGAGELVVAGAAGVAVAILLVGKVQIERFSRTVAAEELTAALELAVISVIVLPLLPRRGYGPWGVFNPFEIWLVVVLVTALSFVGFIAMRLLGHQRGMAATGLVGGLVSSTAVTLSMAERSREGAALQRPAAAAVVLASTVMCLRVAVLGGVVNAGILPRLLPLVVGMGLAGAAAAWVLGHGRQAKGEHPGRRFGNPFSLRRALTFAAIYALVKLGLRAAQEYFGDAGLYVAAALGGLADVDAPTVAFARMGPLEDGWRIPATAVAIALLANTLLKLGLAVGLGTGSFRRFVALGLGWVAIVGAVVAALVHAR